MVKHNLSRVVAVEVFDRRWGLLKYVRPADALHFSDLALADQQFFLIQVALSIPFIWMGVALSLR